MDESVSRRNRLFGLDVARAFAISLVVLAHAHQGSMEIGIYGVELFFALSGFLIGGILHRCVPAEGTWSFAGVVNFWRRRWWRTLPAYYLFLLLAILFHLSRGEVPERGWSGVLPYFLFVPNLMSPNEVFFDVSWSLCVEEAFYLLFPLGLLVVNRATRRRDRSFWIVLASVVLLSFLLREVAFAQWPAAQSRVMTLPRLDAIAYGVAMALWTRTRTFPDRHRSGLAVAGGLVVAASVAAHLLSRPLAEATGFFRFSLMAMPFGFSLCMPLFASWSSLPIRWEWIRSPVTAISLWSYSIYLCHHMILLGVLPWFGEDRESLTEKLLSKGVGLVLVLLVSALVYRCYESPLTRRRPPELDRDGASRAPADSPNA